MGEAKLTKEQQILFEVYDKGVQHEDCNLDAYVEKMKQALSISGIISRLLFKAEKIYGKKIYGNKYDRFSIQIESGEAYLIGHEEMSHEPDWEHKLCNVSELLNDL